MRPGLSLRLQPEDPLPSRRAPEARLGTQGAVSSTLSDGPLEQRLLGGSRSRSARASVITVGLTIYDFLHN